MGMKPNFLTPKKPATEIPESASPESENEDVSGLKQAIMLIKAGRAEEALPILEQVLQHEESEPPQQGEEENPLDALRSSLSDAITGKESPGDARVAQKSGGIKFQ